MFTSSKLQTLSVITVHITVETSRRKYVYSRTSEPLLATLPRVSYTARFCKNNALLISKGTLYILEGSFFLLTPNLFMFLRDKCR